jgi:DNA replication licensing factor MCM3
MVLADRGVVCIDEFDKMSDADRVAIHEVMEQQTVTIAKAGIHMSLNARCSVVAAANPRYSQYDSSKPPNWNVNLPDSLLSRFDFLFIILDTPDAENDRQIAEKVLSNHRYQKRAAEEAEDEAIDYNAIRSEQAAAEQQDTDVYQKFDKLLHAGLLKSAKRQVGGARRPLEILTIPFMKKYIEYAKAQVEPVLTPEAAEFIGLRYAELRQAASEGDKKDHSFPITARSLETLIRLSTAHAKARLDDTVRVEDAEEVLKILRYALEGDKGSKEGERKSKRGAAAEDEDADMEGGADGKDDDDDNDDDGDVAMEESSPAPKPTPTKRKAPAERKTPQAKKGKGEKGQPRTTVVEEAEEVAAPVQSIAKQSTIAPSSARLTEFKKLFSAHFKSLRADSLSYKSVFRAVNEAASEQYSPEEFDKILQLLEKDNLLMHRGGEIHKI